MEFQSAHAHSNESPLVAQTIRNRRLKAFVVVFGASLLVLSTIFSFSTGGFVAKSRVRLGLAKEISDAQIPQTMDRVAELVRNQWDELTRHPSLAEMMKNVGLKSPPGQDVAMSIRNALYYSLESTADGNQTLFISLEGRVSKKETQLVDRLTRYLAGEIALAPIKSLKKEPQKVLPDPKAQFVGRQLAICDRIEWISKQLNQDIDYLKSKLPQDEGLAQNPADPQNQLWRQKLESLRSHRRELASRFNVSSDELQSLDQEIAAVESRLSNPQETALQPPNSNWFKNASYTRSDEIQSEYSLDHAFTSAMQSIDTQSLMVSVGELKQNLEHFHAMDSAAPEKRDENVTTTLPVFVKGIRSASVQPINGGIGPVGVFGLVLLSTLFGSVVAFRYQPLADDRGFKNVEQVTALLRLPVYGQIEKFADEQNEHETHMPVANLLVRSSSILLIACCVLILTALTFSPTMRGAFAENPFEAFLKMIWIYPSG